MLKEKEILVERYQITNYLGSKGFTETYLASDLFLPEKPVCVVKQLRPRFIDPDTLKAAQELFEREAQVLDRLGNHDQIPRLLAYFEDDQKHEFYLIEEFTDGENLDTQLQQRGKLTKVEVIKLLLEVLEILKFVHEQHVIHRDIKPCHIIRRRSDNKIVLTGFGAVKQVETQIVSAQGETSFSIPVGTKGYMPMEQQGGKTRYNSDIYGLGITAIQLLTGIHPSQLQENPQTGEINWRLHIQGNENLANILDKMIRAHHRERYQTVDEVIKDLKSESQLSSEYSHTSKSSDNSDNYSSVIRNVSKRRKWLVPASIGVVAIVAGIIGYTFRNPNLAISQPPRTVSVQGAPVPGQTTPSPAPEPTTAEGFVMRGNQQLDLSSAKEALADFEKALQLQPNSIEASSGKNVAQGWLLFNDNKFTEALTVFDKAVEIKQDNPRAWVGKGYSLLNLEKYQDALNAYDKATQIAPDSKVAWVGRGQALGSLRKYDDAITAFDKVLKIDDKDAFALYQRGQALAALNKYQEAIQSYDKVLNVNDQNQDVWLGKGFALFLSGQREEGLAAVDKAIAIDNNYLPAWLARGGLLNTDGRHEGALAAYEKVLSINSKSVEGWNGKSNALLKLRRLNEAVTAADKAIKVSPNIPSVLAESWNSKANALYESGKYNEALPAYKKVTEIYPNGEGGWSNLSELLNRLKKYDEALAAADRALSIEQTLTGWNQKANALVGLGRYPDAIAAYDQVLKFKSDYHYAWVGKGNAFYRWGKYQEAIAAYDKALEIKPVDRKLVEQPDTFSTWNQKGNALFQLKDYDKALAAYQEAVKIKADFAEGWFNQGKTLFELQKIKEAVAAYDKALDIKNDYPEAKAKREEAVKKL